MNSKFKKLICVCGIMILLGIVMTVIGLIAGGATEGLKKIDEKYDFISLGYDHLNQETYNFKEVKKINVDYPYSNVRVVEGDSFRVDVAYTDDMPVPEVSEADGILSVTKADSEKRGSLLNLEVFGARIKWPEILITCPEDTVIEAVTVRSDYSDVIVSGTSVSKAEITSGSGDITVNGMNAKALSVKSSSGDVTIINTQTAGLNVNSDDGDIVLRGTFKGNSILSSNNGDVEVNSDLSMEEYDISVSGYFDLEMNGSEYDYYDSAGNVYEYAGKNAANSLTVNGDGIDVEMNFGY